jgi:CheY-like chemotaxis protein
MHSSGTGRSPAYSATLPRDVRPRDRDPKGNPRTRNILVIIMTASRKTSDLQACLELGANSFTIKPVDFQKFADSVRSLGSKVGLAEPPSTFQIEKPA